MKKILLLIVLIGAAAAAIFAYREMSEEREREAEAEAPVLAPSLLARGTNGEVTLRLDAATQARLGLVATALTHTTFSPEIIGVARVLDPAPLASVFNDLRSAMISATAAQADFERKTKLFEAGQNAAASAVETAKANLQQQQLAIESARQKLLVTWGTNIATRENFGEFVAALLSRQAALARIDTPVGSVVSRLPDHAVLSAGFNGDVAVAHVLGPAPATDSTVPGPSFLALIATNATRFPSGANLVARLRTGETQEGTLIPRDAVVHYLGATWVYVKTAAETFTRRAIGDAGEHPGGWIVNGKWSEPVAIAGAQALLSEELKGGIQMKD